MKNITSFNDKNLQQIGYRNTYVYVIRSIYSKSTVLIILNSERLKAFSLPSGTIQIWPLSPLSFSTVLEVLARAIMQDKKEKTTKLERKK